jgi:hypothetical protein
MGQTIRFPVSAVSLDGRLSTLHDFGLPAIVTLLRIPQQFFSRKGKELLSRELELSDRLRSFSQRPNNLRISR